MSEVGETVVVLPPAEGRTTVLIWRSAADFFSKKNFEKNFSAAGVSGSAIQAASAALTAPGFRAPIPAPDAASWEAFARAGSALNSALRARHIRGPGAGPLAQAAVDVAAAAAGLGGGEWSGRGERRLCVGRCDRLVYLRTDPRLLAAMHAAADGLGWSLGAWVRDAVAASLGEHAARVPAPETARARTVAGRIVGLLIQAAAVADPGELAAVAAAESAVASAVGRMAGWGTTRPDSRHRATAVGT